VSLTQKAIKFALKSEPKHLTVALLTRKIAKHTLSHKKTTFKCAYFFCRFWKSSLQVKASLKITLSAGNYLQCF